MYENNVNLTLDDTKFATYMIVSSLLVLKTMCLIVLTIYHRIRKNIHISEEDIGLSGGTVELDPEIERVRRSVQNDLENIPAFLVISFVYLWVPVPAWTVQVLYYTFLVFRVLHSIVYAIYVVPQPARGLCFAIPFAILFYMCCHVFVYAFSSVISKNEMSTDKYDL